jgi:hypothetical protein
LTEGFLLFRIKAAVVVEMLEFEYDFHEDVLDSMPDVNYYPESNFNPDDLEY